jgi:bacterioferritin
MSGVQDKIIQELKIAYWMEIETVTNYIANSINLDGVRAEEIKKALAADVQEELTHAQTLARRIKTVGGRVPGSADFRSAQITLQPGADTTDVVSVIKGVIDAENAAIAQYNTLIRLCDGIDYVTQDLCIQSLADEEEHRRDFIGYLAEYAAECPAPGSPDE